MPPAANTTPPALDPAEWSVGRYQIPAFTPPPDDPTCDVPGISRNMQERHAAGTAIRLAVGHVQQRPDYPESMQPKVIGRWLPPFTVGTFNGQATIFATPAVRREYILDAIGRPYRSPEYYRGKKLVTGIALLSRDPALNLGTFDLADVFASQEQPTHHVIPGAVNMADVMPKPEEKTIAGAGAAPPVDGVPEGHDAWKANMEHYAKNTPYLSYAAKCYDASQAAAGGAGSVAPTDTNVAAAGAAKPGEPANMQANAVAELLALKIVNGQLAKRLELVEKDSAAVKLGKLKDEMRLYSLSDADLAAMDTMDAGSLQVYAATVRKHCTRTTPHTAADLIDVAGNQRLGLPGEIKSDPENGIVSEKHANYALEYMRDKGCDWDAAVKATSDRK